MSITSRRAHVYELQLMLIYLTTRLTMYVATSDHLIVTKYKCIIVYRVNKVKVYLLTKTIFGERNANLL